MKERYKISYQEDFARKFKNITDYISYELQNPIASSQFRINLIQKLSILSYFPSAMPMYRDTNYHYLIMKHWLIFYEINGYSVEVSHIFSSKQNLNSKFL